MYIPPHFEETDRHSIAEIIAQFPLAVLVYQCCGDVVAQHLPLMMLDEKTCIGHVALANDMHKHADGAKAMAIFRAEDNYISPNWYPTKQQTHQVVPTWNYQIVHVYGRLEFSHDRNEKAMAVAKLTHMMEQRYSPDQMWQMSDTPQEYRQEQLDNIVALRFTVTKILAKSKISQNKENTDFNNVCQKMAMLDKPVLHRAMQRHKERHKECKAYENS